MELFDRATDDERNQIRAALKIDDEDLRRAPNCVVSALGDLEKDELEELYDLITKMNPNLIQFTEEEQ